MIFVKNLASASNQEWSTTEKYPGVRWKFLIDADFDGSSGLSLGFAEIELIRFNLFKVPEIGWWLVSVA